MNRRDKISVPNIEMTKAGEAWTLGDAFTKLARRSGFVSGLHEARSSASRYIRPFFVIVCKGAYAVLG